MTSDRTCIDCKVVITNCMGFVNATDWLAKEPIVRELCGKCVTLRDLKAGLLPSELFNSIDPLRDSIDENCR